MAKRSNPTLPRATTNEVVPPLEEPHIEPKWERHFLRLLDLRDELLRQKRDWVRYAAEEQPDLRLHLADAGTDNYDRDIALSMISSEQNACYEVEEALRRIRDGVYGICELTGKPIEPERLYAIPWTRFCLEAESRLEAKGEVEHRSLGKIPRSPEEEATDAQERDGPKE